MALEDELRDESLVPRLRYNPRFIINVMTGRKQATYFCQSDIIPALLRQVPAFGWKPPEPPHPHEHHHVLQTPPLYCLVEEPKYAANLHLHSRINLRQIRLRFEQVLISVTTNKHFMLLGLCFFVLCFGQTQESEDKKKRMDI